MVRRPWASPRSAAWGVPVLLLAGCVATAPQEDVATFSSPGAFEAAVAAGAKVLGAAEDPGVRGARFASLPLQAADLDAAWGEDRYALESIHWWGPAGAPSLHGEGSGGATSIGIPGPWQGFLLQAGHLQVLPGDLPKASVRSLGDQFLQNVTTLDAAGRQAVLDDLLGSCDGPACTTSTIPGIDAARAWQRAGGLAAASDERLEPGSGALTLGDWWFRFWFDEATLLDRSGEGHTILEVGSNDVVSFTWRSGRQHSDEASHGRMGDVLQDAGIAVPPAGSFTWTHREAETD